MVLNDEVRYLHLSVHQVHLVLEVPLKLVKVVMTWALQMRDWLRCLTIGIVCSVKILTKLRLANLLMRVGVVLCMRSEELRNDWVLKLLYSRSMLDILLKFVKVLHDKSQLLLYS